VEDSVADRANSRRSGLRTSAIESAPTNSGDDRWVVAHATATSLCSDRSRGACAQRRSDSVRARRARPVGWGYFRRARRCSVEDDVRDCVRRVLRGRIGVAHGRRRTSSPGWCRYSAEDPGAPDVRQACTDRFAVRRRLEVRDAGNQLNRGHVGPFEELRSTGRSAGPRPSGRHGSRPVVAHRRRDEAKDFERAPDNATKGLLSPDLDQGESASSTLVVSCVRRHGRQSTDLRGSASPTPGPCTR
jgi:hypothetical protein